MTDQNLPAEPPPEVHSQRRTMLWVARALTYFVYAYVVLTEIVLLLGFVLLLFGANPDPAFVQWAYRALDRAMEPFRGIFTPIELGETSGNVEAVLDTSILFAMVIYGLVGWGLRELIDWLTLPVQAPGAGRAGGPVPRLRPDYALRRSADALRLRVHLRE